MTALTEKTSSTSIRLLLVDDHPAGLAARKSVLEELGFHITTACSGESAITQFQAEPFPLVVTDYRLPGMSGVDLIASIRKISADTRIVLLSGFVDALGLTEDATHADVVISKSSNEVVHLIRAVQRLTRRTAAKKPGRSRKTVPPKKLSTAV